MALKENFLNLHIMDQEVFLKYKRLMGQEYADSFEGKVYFAVEKIMFEASVGKFSSLFKKIIGIYPESGRTLGYEIVYLNARPLARFMNLLTISRGRIILEL